MALSDRDKEILNALEANLLSSDPKLASIMTSQSKSPSKNPSFTLRVVLTILGMVIVLTGLITKNPLVGVAGFLLALYGFQAVISNFSTRHNDSGAKIAKAKKSMSNGLSKRLEERWDKRGFDQN